MSVPTSVPQQGLHRACWALPLGLLVAFGMLQCSTAATPRGLSLARSAAAVAFVSPTHHERTVWTKGIDRRRTSHYLSAEASQQQQQHTSSSLTSEDDEHTTTAVDPLGLTPELRKLTNAFQAIGDDKLRYKQLLYMANQLAAMDDSHKIPENKVPGCLSTVHIHATIVASPEEGSAPLIQFTGDSDGLLTKGLVALLVRGLSGNTAHAIQAVDPTFIQQAGIAASLTPGRNNGFLNMLAVMKRKAIEAAEAMATETMPETTRPSTSSSSAPSSQPSSSSSTRPKYDAIVAALQALKPVQLDLVDNSHQHAGHAGASPEGESHFDLYIVADAFEGLNLVKRHKLVYMMLGDLMPRIHALQIRAQTPAEAGL